MPLSWNEIRTRAIQFSKEWENESKEDAEAKSFWDDFFSVFGISRRRVASFEHAVKKLNQKQGFIDLFWKGTLIVEHKSRGKNLEKAYNQALDYFQGLKEEELPKFILVSDFVRFRLYDLDENQEYVFLLSEFHKNIKLFDFIAGYQKVKIREESPINIKAAEKMGILHDFLKESGYSGHDLEVYLIRLLFMLFADDTGIFEKDIFWDFIENHTAEDGHDLACKLAQIFEVMNKKNAERFNNLHEIYAQFPYVNGKLFEEHLQIASFDSKMRRILLDCCSLDWALISPAIFGSLFQSIMDKKARRNLGAHYTSEKNILKLIKPLFLDELWADFEKIKHNTKQLNEFHQKLGKLKFLDPACGSGNFLIIAYRELRQLELAILQEVYKKQQVTQIEQIIWLNIDQFYGIEIDEWAVRISEVAMWLVDHQMNMLISEKFGHYFARIPLKKSANILHDNALKIDWEKFIPKNELSYILGNPPFIGSRLQTKEQKKELIQSFNNSKNISDLDYVSAWYIKASQYIENTKIKVAFVSTNSITQGEQVSLLWNEMLNRYHVKIHFAHRTFKWSNEAKGQAGVYVIIVGFANFETKDKIIFDYEDIKAEATAIIAKNINPYLIDAPNLLINKQINSISKMPKMSFGNMPLDGGNLLFTDEEKNIFLKKEPKSEKYFFPLISAREFLTNKKRWCLWLVNINPTELRSMKEVLKKVESVKKFRLNSVSLSTQKYSETPALFIGNRQPKTDYIAIPRVSSENRKYIPIAFFDKNYIVSDTMLFVPDATLFDFGVLTSEIHMTWVKYTCGRLKSDYRYSKHIVYNNYPFPKKITPAQKKRVEKFAQLVLDTRLKYPNSSLADLYNPLSMPSDLLQAHKQLDKAVDLCYRRQKFINEKNRIEFLFDLYSQYVTPLQAEIKKQKKQKRKKNI